MLKWRIPMKKLLLATAIAALSVSAQAAPQVYGKAFLTLDYTDANGASSKTALNSNSSRIGVKGAERLTTNTDLVYQLEYRVDVDSDKQRNFESRDTYLGLSNKQYGTVLAGRLSTIDGMVDYANVASGGVVGGDGILSTFDAPRASNAIAYVSPNYNGVNFLGMYGLDSDQDSGVNSSPVDLVNAESKWGLGVQYEPANQPFRAGATYIQAGDVKIARVSGAYDINSALTVGALYQNTDLKQAKKENTFTASAQMKTATPWSVYGQFDLQQNVKGAKDADDQRIVAGGKYAFNQATTGHVYAGYINHDRGSKDTKEYGVGAGLEYNF